MRKIDNRLVERLDSVPTLPSVVMRILEIVLDENASARDAAKVVEADQALSSKVLKVVNSAAYGLRHKVSTVRHAIALLGFSTLKTLVLSISVYEGLLEGRKDMGMDKALFWQHSLACAAAARALAQQVGYDQPDEAYVAGLLHDIGKVILDQHASAPFHQVLQKQKDGNVAGLEVEREVLNVDHGEVGGWVAKRWHLPAMLCKAIRGHHHLPAAEDEEEQQRARQLCMITMLSDFLAWTQGIGSVDAKRPPIVPPEVEAAFKLKQEHLNQITESIDTEMGKMAEVFNIPAPDAKRFRQALQRANIELGRMTSLYDQAKRQLERRVRELIDLNEAVRRARQTLDVDGVRTTILEAVHKGLGFDRAVFLQVDHEKRTIVGIDCKDQTNLHFDAKRINYPLEPHKDFIQKCAEVQKPACYGRQKERENLAAQLMEVLDVDEIGIAPILSGQQVRGFIAVDNGFSKLPVTAVSLNSLGILASEAGLAIENAMLFERTRELAIKDELTTVFNRRQILEQLLYEMERARRYDRPLSVAMCDLDHFKAFNDTYGHLAGDRILQDVAKLIQSASRESDIVGRYGGEEFLVLLPETELDHAIVYGERIRKIIERYGETKQNLYPEVHLTISLGLAAYKPEEDGTRDALIDRADQALYAAKGRGRNCVCVAS